MSNTWTHAWQVHHLRVHLRPAARLFSNDEALSHASARLHEERGWGWQQVREIRSLILGAAPQVTDFAGCSNFIVVALVSFLLAQSFFLRQVGHAASPRVPVSLCQTSPNSSEH